MVAVGLRSHPDEVANWVLPFEKYSNWPRTGRSGDRIAVEVRSAAPVQTGTEAHPDSYAMDTGSFSGYRSRGVVDYPTSSSAEVK